MDDIEEPSLPKIRFVDDEGLDFANVKGTVVVFSDHKFRRLFPIAEAVDSMIGGALSRSIEAPTYRPSSVKTQAVETPDGIAAERLVIASLGSRNSEGAARRCGNAIATAHPGGPLTLLVSGVAKSEQIAWLIMALAARLDASERRPERPVTDVVVASDKPDILEAFWEPLKAHLSGIILARDTTMHRAGVNADIVFQNARLVAETATKTGSVSEILPAMQDQRVSNMAKRTIVIEREGLDDTRPVVLVTDMVTAEGSDAIDLVGYSANKLRRTRCGAGTVLGVMQTLGLRKSKASVNALIGIPDRQRSRFRVGELVQMPDDRTVEIADNESASLLILGELLDLVQRIYKPRLLISLASTGSAANFTLSSAFGAHFSNMDRWSRRFESACRRYGEQTWRMPLDPVFLDLMKSDIADLRTPGGSNGALCASATFLNEFVNEATPWLHIDVSNVALSESRGATGWGVLPLNELIQRKAE